MRSVIFTGIALVVVTVAVYWQVGNHKFVSGDDDIFIAHRDTVTTGINIDNIVWAFTPVRGLGWHPLTWLSHMADAQFYGPDPRGHHYTNVVIHTAATLLLFILLFRLTNAPWKSSFVAALFALHPLHVESVAWIAERRDVLSAFFGFFALWLYAEYVKQRKLSLYVLALFTFVLGLMSKPMLVTLPIIMLLLDYWPLNRCHFNEKSPEQQQWRVTVAELSSLVKEKIPFFACSFISAAITINVPPPETLQSFEVIPLGARIANAITAYLKYVVKILWPNDLAVYYPFPAKIPFWQFTGSLLILIAITAAIILARKRLPYLAVGWFWYLIALVPVLGLVQFASQSTADRYTYVPSVGFFIAATWSVAKVTEKLKNQKVILSVIASGIIAASAALTWQQLTYWRDDVTLFQQAIRVTSGNYVAHNNLGNALFRKGRVDEAVNEYEKAIEIKPDFVAAYNNLGLIYYGLGYYDKSLYILNKSISIMPENIEAQVSIGNSLLGKGSTDQAIQAYNKALLIKKDHIEARNNLGVAYHSRGDYDSAIIQFKEILSRYPDHVDARYNLELALEQKGQVDKSQQSRSSK